MKIKTQCVVYVLVSLFSFVIVAALLHLFLKPRYFLGGQLTVVSTDDGVTEDEACVIAEARVDGMDVNEYLSLRRSGAITGYESRVSRRSDGSYLVCVIVDREIIGGNMYVFVGNNGKILKVRPGK